MKPPLLSHWRDNSEHSMMLPFESVPPRDSSWSPRERGGCKKKLKELFSLKSLEMWKLPMTGISQKPNHSFHLTGLAKDQSVETDAILLQDGLISCECPIQCGLVFCSLLIPTLIISWLISGRNSQQVPGGQFQHQTPKKKALFWEKCKNLRNELEWFLKRGTCMLFLDIPAFVCLAQLWLMLKEVERSETYWENITEGIQL